MIILSVDARLYISNWSAAVRVHVFGEKIHEHVLRKGQYCFSLHYAAFWTLLEHLNIKNLHMHVQYLHVHTRGVPAPLAQSVKSPLRET